MNDDFEVNMCLYHGIYSGDSCQAKINCRRCNQEISCIEEEDSVLNFHCDYCIEEDYYSCYNN